MNNSARNALQGPIRGESVTAIIVFADVRGFSDFCKRHDSAEVALYVSKLFKKPIDQFEQILSTAFFKSTGDGLMMVFPYDGDEFQDLYRSIVAGTLEIHDAFGDLMEDVPAINFDTPNAIGFSVVRGAVSALTTVGEANSRTVVDYTGHRVNMAARLQDLARPSGVILEGSKDFSLLDIDVLGRFFEENVYVRSVAHTTPMKIWCLEGIRVPEVNRKPLDARWESKVWKWPKEDLPKLPARQNLILGPGVIDDSIMIKFKRTRHPDNEAGSEVIWVELFKDTHFQMRSEKDTKIARVFVEQVREKYTNFIEACPEGGEFTCEVIYQTLEPVETSV